MNKLTQHLEAYKNYLSLEKGLSVLTTQSYLSDLSSFSAFMNKLGRETMSEVCLEDVEAFLGQPKPEAVSGKEQHPNLAVAQDFYKESSLARKISVLRNYFNFLQREGVLEHNFSHLLESPKLTRHLPECMTQDEVAEFLAKFPEKTLLDHRDKLIFEYLYVLGLRISEVRGLSMEQVRLTEGFVTVDGKGGKRRLLPLLERLAVATQTYLTKVRPLFLSKVPDNGEKCLFLSQRGKSLSRVGLWKMIKQRLLTAGITKHVTPHTFRHSCATHLLQNGASLRLVQEILGHSNIQTTEIYTHVMREDLKQAAERYHPFYD